MALACHECPAEKEIKEEISLRVPKVREGTREVLACERE